VNHTAMRVHRPDGPVLMMRMVMVQDDHGTQR
jgi:hypothetical protein